ncbi:DUF3923 family protein [Peptostreptococcus equinus]|uniref:DUF3923 family protein n=1 Tax=Peptostreptococcus equinus TaxID=3003601 RepID=UPI003BF528D1
MEYIGNTKFIFLVFLFIRTVDGHNAIQTLEIKRITFAVFRIFYLGILVIEWGIYSIVCFLIYIILLALYLTHSK